MKKRVSLVLLYGTCIGAYNPHQIKLVKKSIAQKKKVNASGADFRGAGILLKGLQGSGGQFSGANFGVASAQSKGLPFSINTPGATTDLTGADFSKSACVSTTFKQANLTNANFSKANVQLANFNGANLTGVNFTGAKNINTALFCNATMPDGSKCSGKNWTSKTGQVFTCQCPSKQSAPSNAAAG